MSKNSAAHQKKFVHAMQVLQKAPDISVSKAMILAQFLKKDIADESVHWVIRRLQD
jgi:hypothetical protein